ncbi:hypothetical protein G9A89_011143 [Geosiphon pyriformis]|nr:hypothetical protein G9A89_011143 [Geosiphon pyriformis]
MSKDFCLCPTIYKQMDLWNILTEHCSGKFENKWDGLFFIHKVLGNGLYKLRLDDKILAKVAHGNCLKHYHSRNNPEPLIPQIGTHSPLVNPEDIP